MSPTRVPSANSLVMSIVIGPLGSAQSSLPGMDVS
jgi:hypothetical protein